MALMNDDRQRNVVALQAGKVEFMVKLTVIAPSQYVIFVKPAEFPGLRPVDELYAPADA